MALLPRATDEDAPLAHPRALPVHRRHAPLRHGRRGAGLRSDRSDPAGSIRDHGRARQRPPLLRPGERPAGEPCGTAPRHQRRVHPRGRGSTRTRAFRRAHGLQRHGELREAGARRLPRVDRDAVRPRHQRLHQLRRDRLHAPGADGRPGDAGDRLPDPRGLGGRRALRPRGSRQGARGRNRGMAWPPGGPGAHAGPAVPDHVRGVAVRRTPAHREARDPRNRPRRAIAQLLRGLVSAGPDGDRRGRRLQRARDRSDDSGTVRPAAGSRGRPHPDHGRDSDRPSGARGHRDRHRGPAEPGRGALQTAPRPTRHHRGLPTRPRRGPVLGHAERPAR